MSQSYIGKSGWQLFHDIFREPQTHLWPLAEKHLYHQYHEHFDEVALCLDRMLKEAPDEAGKAWGRIATLVLINVCGDFKRIESINVAETY